MIPILQKPVMGFTRLLRQHGFDQIMVNVSPAMRKLFPRRAAVWVKIAYSFEGRIIDGALVGEAIGSAGGMRRTSRLF